MDSLLRRKLGYRLITSQEYNELLRIYQGLKIYSYDEKALHRLQIKVLAYSLSICNKIVHYGRKESRFLYLLKRLKLVYPVSWEKYKWASRSIHPDGELFSTLDLLTFEGHSVSEFLDDLMKERILTEPIFRRRTPYLYNSLNTWNQIQFVSKSSSSPYIGSLALDCLKMLLS